LKSRFRNRRTTLKLLFRIKDFHNQSAIQAIANPKCPSGQYILAKAIQAVYKYLISSEIKDGRPNSDGHIGVPGNKVADRAAKEATGHNPNARTNLEP